jgi:hypothetical protein
MRNSTSEIKENSLQGNQLLRPCILTDSTHFPVLAMQSVHFLVDYDKQGRYYINIDKM